MLNKSELTTNELLILQSEIRNAEKSLGLAYLMLLGGHLGLHRFYLKRFVSGSIQLILFLVATVSYFSFIFLSEFGASEMTVIILGIALVALPGLTLFVWVIVDLFLLGGMVRDWNTEAERQIIQQLEQYRHQTQPDSPSL
jgi:hypothetical protein